MKPYPLRKRRDGKPNDLEAELKHNELMFDEDILDYEYDASMIYLLTAKARLGKILKIRINKILRDHCE